MHADDVRRRQAAFVVALGGDPDIAVLVQHGDVAAGRGGQPAVIDAAHDGCDLLCRGQVEEFHRIESSLSIRNLVRSVRLYHADRVLSHRAQISFGAKIH